MKKSISILMAIVMAVVMIPSGIFMASALTSGGYEYTVTSSKATITDYTGTAEDLTIPSTLDSYSVAAIGEAAFKDCSALKSVTIPDSVIIIGDTAFGSCTALKSVTIPDSVITIGTSAFAFCSELKSVTIPDSITAVSGQMFYSCTGLTDVSIPTGVTSIGAAAFFGCTGLAGITIPSTVKTIGESAFFGCNALTTVAIPNGVTSLGKSAFQSCAGLKTVTIPDSITAIADSNFADCAALTSITIPESVKSISDNAFTNSKAVVISCKSTSYAYTYAVKNKITVKRLDTVAVTGITLSVATASLIVGNTKQLTATVLPADATDSSVTWTSSSAAIATVSSSGLITAVSPGPATVTCTANDSSGKSAVCTLTVIPKAVTAPKAVSIANTKLKLAWTPVSDVTGYAVFRATSQTGYYHYIGKTAASNYTDSSLITGQTFYYKVKAYKTVNEKNYYSASSAIFYAKPIPATPATVIALRASSSSIKVLWSTVSGATGYVVYRYFSATKTYNRIKVTKTTSFTDVGLKTGYNYYYKVRAYQTINGANVYGNPSGKVFTKTY